MVYFNRALSFHKLVFVSHDYVEIDFSPIVFVTTKVEWHIAIAVIQSLIPPLSVIARSV